MARRPFMIRDRIVFGLARSVVVCALVALTGQSSAQRAVEHQAPGPIRWRTGNDHTPLRSVDSARDAAARITALAQETDHLARHVTDRHIIVQFEQPVSSELRVVLAGAGVELLHSLGEN